MADDHEVNAFEVVSVDGFLAAVPSLGFKGLQESGRVSVGATGDPSTSPISVVTTGVLPINAKDYGAVGDGVTDDTAALQAAVIVARSEGRELLIPRGDYLVSASITDDTDTADVSIRGEGVGVTRLLMDGGMTEAVIVVSGSGMGSAATVSSPSAIGDSTLTITDTSGLAAGDVVMVRDSTQPIYGNSGRTTAALTGEWARVKSVDSGTRVTLYGPLDFAYTTSADVRKLSSVSSRISDLTIVNTAPGTQDILAKGIALNFCRDVRLERLGFEQMDAPSLYLQYGLDILISDCTFRDSLDLEQTNNPYCIALAKTVSDALVSNCRSRYGRHLFTTLPGTSDAAPAYIRVSDCLAVEHSQAAFDIHPGTRKVTFVDCEVHGSWPDTTPAGFQIRGPDCNVINCIVTNTTGIGVVAVYGADRCQIIGGRFSRCGTGVQIHSSDDCFVGSDVLIENATTDGVNLQRNANYAAQMTRVQLGDIRVRGNPSGYAVNNTVGGLTVNYL